jgi:hypothetical protein
MASVLQFVTRIDSPLEQPSSRKSIAAGASLAPVQPTKREEVRHAKSASDSARARSADSNRSSK